MPSSAVPNTDLPDPDLRGAGTGSGPAGDAWAARATLLRCDGCGASAVIDQGEHQYGGLVHNFLGHHAGCGNAVQITRTQPGES